MLHATDAVAKHSGVPVVILIGQRLEPTLALSANPGVLAMLLAVPLGIMAAWTAGTWMAVWS
jgi:peptide/nickel transport system permease protein